MAIKININSSPATIVPVDATVIDGSAHAVTGNAVHDYITTAEISISQIKGTDLQPITPVLVETVVTLNAMNTANTAKRILEVTGGGDAGIYFHTGTVLKKLTTSDVAIPAVAPSFLTSDTHTMGWYIADQQSTVIRDGSQRVATWNDYLGSGRNLTNGGANNDYKPVWSSDGIEFNGTFNFLKATFTLAQPTFIYLVVKIYANSPDYGPLFGGATSGGNGTIYALNMASSPVIRSSATGAEINGVVTAGNFLIIRALYSGASSKLTVGTTTTTGSAGTASMGGIIVGSNAGEYVGGYSHIQVKELIVRKISDTTDNETAVYNYLKSKYSL